MKSIYSSYKRNIKHFEILAHDGSDTAVASGCSCRDTRLDFSHVLLFTMCSAFICSLFGKLLRCYAPSR